MAKGCFSVLIAFFRIFADCKGVLKRVFIAKDQAISECQWLVQHLEAAYVERIAAPGATYPKAETSCMTTGALVPDVCRV
jgi:hypothetical protein